MMPDGKSAQRDLLMPLLEALRARGGRARTRELYAAVAERAGVDPEHAARRSPVGRRRQRISAFERTVRWAQQHAKLLELARPVGDGDWEITGRGRRALQAARPGVVVTLFTTDRGVALWARCEDALGWLDDGSVQLILTSPPYPLLREKAYGNLDEAAYVDWLSGIMELWPRKLTGDGSIVLNLADVWTRGRPAQSLYQERLLLALHDKLGLNLCQRFAWRNPAKLPAPAEWVTVRRERVKPELEQLYHLSSASHPYADNGQVLRPYSASMKARLAAGGEVGGARPSGHRLAPGAFGADAGGAIPGNLIEAANTASGARYLQRARAAGLPVHPARFPAALPEFFIRYLTRRDDLVVDPFAGSGTVARVAQDLGRRWVISERVREYVAGARLRFEEDELLRLPGA